MSWKKELIVVLLVVVSYVFTAVVAWISIDPNFGYMLRFEVFTQLIGVLWVGTRITLLLWEHVIWKVVVKLQVIFVWVPLLTALFAAHKFVTEGGPWVWVMLFAFVVFLVSLSEHYSHARDAIAGVKKEVLGGVIHRQIPPEFWTIIEGVGRNDSLKDGTEEAAEDAWTRERISHAVIAWLFVLMVILLLLTEMRYVLAVIPFALYVRWRYLYAKELRERKDSFNRPQTKTEIPD
jgi:hypothetical protein